MMGNALKFRGNPPITRIGMHPCKPFIRIVLLAMLGAWAPAEAGKRHAKSISVVAPEPKSDQTLATPPKPAAAEPGNCFSFAAVLCSLIEAKVEKPQVTFTLLKEPPPTKEIRFEASFMDNILKLDRENTFVPGETYGRE